MFELGDGLIGLWDVHVHLVTIKVSVVWGTDREVEPERVIGQYPDPMSHHTHSMQRRLTIKQHIITIL